MRSPRTNVQLTNNTVQDLDLDKILTIPDNYLKVCTDGNYIMTEVESKTNPNLLPANVSPGILL